MLSAFLSSSDEKINRRSRVGFEPTTSCLLVQTSFPTRPPSLLVASGRFESYTAEGTATNKKTPINMFILGAQESTEHTVLTNLRREGQEIINSNLRC